MAASDGILVCMRYQQIEDHGLEVSNSLLKDILPTKWQSTYVQHGQSRACQVLLSLTRILQSWYMHSAASYRETLAYSLIIRKHCHHHNYIPHKESCCYDISALKSIYCFAIEHFNIMWAIQTLKKKNVLWLIWGFYTIVHCVGEFNDWRKTVGKHTSERIRKRKGADRQKQSWP